jgi:hypothetical protein
LWLFNFFFSYIIIFKKKGILNDLSASRDLIVVRKFADNEKALSLSVEVGFTMKKVKMLKFSDCNRGACAFLKLRFNSSFIEKTFSFSTISASCKFSVDDGFSPSFQIL